MARPQEQKPPYRELLALARRRARRAEDAEDIVQEVLVAAFLAGRHDYSRLENRRWMAGAIRKRAAFDARSAVRRRRREAHWAGIAPGRADADDIDRVDVFEVIAGLSPALRVVAALTLSGHSRAEIAYLLDLGDDAMRQRIRALKVALARRGVEMPRGTPGLNLDLVYGAIREALLPALAPQRARFASHDPDGHLFLVRSSQKS